VLLTVDARGRHAIFGGNCDSLVVENNHVTLWRASESAWWPTDGIRIFGMLGRMVIVRQNHVVDFTIGVTLQGIGKPAPTTSPLWEISDNLLATAAQTNTGGGPVVAANNVS
jgi:hypothetical protein